MIMASLGHKDTVELLLDRGADLEAKDWVSAAAMSCFCAADRAGRHGRAGQAAAMVVTGGRVVLLWRAGV